MKKAKLAAVSVVMAFGFSQTQVLASGIPTVDIASLMQELVSYNQQIIDYTEQLYQSQVSANEYLQKLEQLRQIYIEYEHTLDQIEGLEAYVEQEVWESLLEFVELTFDTMPISDIWSRWDESVFDNADVAEVDARVAAQYERIRNLEPVYKDIEETFTSVGMQDKKKAQARQHFFNSRQTTEQRYSEEVFREQASQLNQALTDVKEARETNATGDQSQLRTLQTMALQAELELEYQKHHNDILVKSLELSNQESIARKNRQSRLYDSQLREQLNQANREPYQAQEDRNWTVNF